MDFGQKQENDSMILEVRIVFSLGLTVIIGSTSVGQANEASATVVLFSR